MRTIAAELRSKYAEINNLVTAALNEGTDCTALVEQMEALLPQIENAERVERLEKPIRRTGPSAVHRSTGNSFGDDDGFFRAVATAGIRNHVDPRLLQNASGDLMQEGGASGGADGGYLLPVDKRKLQSLIVPPESIFGMTDVLTTPANAVTLPTDEDPVWSSVLGAEDVNEAAALTEQKAALASVTMTLVKKGVLVRVTGEMLEDGTDIGSYVLNKSAQKLSWALDKLAFAAFLASGAKITLAKTSGAAAGSAPDIANVQKMWTSMPVQFRRNAVWFANPQLETVFQGYHIAGSAGGVFPIYIPAGGISEGPYAKIFGRPVIYSELCPAVGTEGDLMLAAPQTFFGCMKSRGPRSDVSIHSEFAKDIVAFRSYVRAVCVSKFSDVIVRGDGTDAGNVITVATRE